ncbi:nitrilase-related carbon-nitrogen hydrolase [Arthrobacter sp. SLBN-112]|uniref:nitrilase-related carbon-nitrogen hydrolase n=1 Tax=Arthrobacter sp. SLBN-112 TaxID=2768452 RepID=UPI002812198D|nr:nitrilase-related carbon-nitrogen hydrolase [Arthrobacter sp. SLBN-112]
MLLSVLQANAAVLDVEANLRTIDVAASRAARAGAGLLLTPELFPVGYAPLRLRNELDPATLPAIRDRLAGIARRNGIALVYSVPAEAAEAAEPAEATEAAGTAGAGVVSEGGSSQGMGRVGSPDWNISASLVDATGAELLRYAKVHLFGDEERKAFVAANEPPAVVDFLGIRTSLLICYDIEFPEAARAAAARGAELLLVPTALSAGFETVPQVLVRARALESQLTVAYANHCGTEGSCTFGGGSVVAGPDGRLLAEAGNAPELLFATVDPEAVRAARDEVPYLRERRPELYREWEAGLAPEPDRPGDNLP